MFVVVCPGVTVLKGSMLVLSHLRRSRKPRLVPLRGVQTYLQVTQIVLVFGCIFEPVGFPVGSLAH